jgi:hypothetical protein
MPKPFHKLTLEEFADLINILPFRRQINGLLAVSMRDSR